ncbi:hypothetical protein DICVIV_03212 [Dictyocaulus viviparus]|uniref:Uncharacterized protein n=1 Tax=Dictyocaulus viviparus TaxID=29172 RepID=A0A0D8Y1Q8_DICVI|nr:hypothetical protein DICVIV_03212 [Dictyocaulus viviparus]
MASIEVITSQEREVKMRKITGEPYTILVRVWNETVSNLTLMALEIEFQYNSVGLLLASFGRAVRMVLKDTEKK